MANMKYWEIANRLEERINDTGIESIPAYRGAARLYGLRDERKITVYVDVFVKIKKTDYDMSKIRRFMENQDLI